MHGETGKNVCKDCGYTSIHKNYIKRHRDTVHKLGKKLFCESCPYKTYHPYALKHHIKLVHEKSKEYLCDKCSYTSTLQDQLKKHQDIMHGPRDKKYRCDHCAFKTHQKQYLKTHLINIHTKGGFRDNNPNHGCSICGRKFKNFAGLSGHMNLHGGFYKRDANGRKIAPKGTTGASGVVEDSKSNSPDDWVECTVCRSKFKNLACLNRHMSMRLHHGGYQEKNADGTAPPDVDVQK